MTLAETLVAVWQQMLAEEREAVRAGERSYGVGRTRGRGLRTVEFEYGDWRLTGIEQNPEKTSRWAMLARQGKRIVQFKHGARFIGNVCDGRLTRYPAWKDAGLPD
jgi:hypothetical protein